MQKSILYTLSFFICFITFGQQQEIEFPKLNDGPYVFIEENNLVEKSIVNGKVITNNLNVDSYKTIYTPNKEIYSNIKEIVALSDIHGQYNLAVDLLRNNNVIDKNLNWNFGKGHLVIVGDIFDRGNQVHEMLLLVYKLEQQAIKKGGRVHFLLGNHEYMVLHKDLRYVSEKYINSAKTLGVEYNELYSENTILGRWLRSKSTMVKINDNIFVHGGISQEFLDKNNFDITNINNIMRASISRSKTDMKATDFYKIYYGKTSLIWYRGYFNDGLDDSHISNILEQINSNHVVVGHCSRDTISILYDGKIYGVDSSIKKGKYGELLFIKKGKYSRGTLNGERIKF